MHDTDAWDDAYDAWRDQVQDPVAFAEWDECEYGRYTGGTRAAHGAQVAKPMPTWAEAESILRWEHDLAQPDYYAYFLEVVRP